MTDTHAKAHLAAMAKALGADADTHAGSMTQRLLRAMAEVTAPLHAQIDDLQARLDALEGKAARKPASK